MNCGGKITAIGYSLNNHLTVTLEVEDITLKELQNLETMGELSLEIKKYRKKRSDDANRYLWKLLQEMAVRLRTDRWSLYLLKVRAYGMFDVVVLRPEAAEAFGKMFRAYEILGEVTVNGKTGTQVMCIRGTSTYDTKEMSYFLDRIIEDAKELDIETRTPDEIARMKQEWGV